ncbi:hypothetical protein [Afipia clevelandensis]|uniref:Uncharacterized protein n=1 Tax=Afipia clevelandensis ATCC 49720 TaxID=883079 RepID=K8PGI5_9BRAD|nr:hypothetical protein [Afipia clevelandensis]EKS38665.1 hypothetical protein HMPREF9696_01134 [Afipia clevelandensis ATCC 49720]
MSISITTTPLVANMTSGKLDKPLGAQSVEEKFLEYAKKTPAEKMFDAMLGQLGITPEQFAAMDPDAQRAVMEKIQKLIEQQAKAGGSKDPGQITDKTA